MGGFLPSRRRFLGGAGVVVGLPFLESALPRSAWGQAAPAIQRFMPVFFPNGVDKRGWVRDPAGGDYLQPSATILAALAPVRARTAVLDGLANMPGFGAHEKATLALLTVEEPGYPQVSVDQVIANGVGAQTRIKSLQLGIYAGKKPISYAAQRQPLPPVSDPRRVFDTIFAGFDPNASSADVQKRQRYESSVLDYALGELAEVAARVSRADRATLDAYASGLRELEKRIAASSTALVCTKPAPPPSNVEANFSSSLDYPTVLGLMMDMAVLAFQCDATRVITLHSNTDGDGHRWLGAPENHHDLSHWGSDVAKRDKVKKIDEWEMQQFAAMAVKMNTIPEGGATLLDNSLVFFTSEIEEGDNHASTNLPLVVCGTAGGKFQTGRYLRLVGNLGSYKYKENGNTMAYGSNLSMAMYYRTVIQAFGLPDQPFGADGTRILTQVLA